MTSKPQANGRAFGLIMLIVFLDLLGVNLLAPVQAFIVRPYSLDALAVGLLTVIYSLGQFVAAPILGAWSDRVGRRPVLLLCLLGSAMGYIIFGIGGALWVLYLARLIDGITGGNLSVGLAYVADVTPAEKRAQSFALVGAAFGLGFLLGPAIGGALGQISLALPAFVAAGLSLLALALGIWFLPESLPKEARAARLSSINPLGSLFGLVRRSGLGALLAASFIFNFAFAGMVSNLSVFLIDKFGATPLRLALAFVASGIANIVVQGGLVRSLTPRFGEKRLALAGFAILIAGWLGLVAAPALWAVYPLAGLAGAGSALIFPTLAALASTRVAESEQGKLQGISASLASLANVVGPLWAGAAYDHVAAAAPYWSAALVLALAALMVAGLKRGASHSISKSA